MKIPETDPDKRPATAVIDSDSDEITWQMTFRSCKNKGIKCYLEPYVWKVPYYSKISFDLSDTAHLWRLTEDCDDTSIPFDMTRQ